MKNVESKIVNVTSEYAIKLLEKNHTGQIRRRNKRHVKKLARLMAEGNWQDLNGDTVVIDTDGRVIDGQHRLLAVIESNCCITTILVTGVSPEAYYSIDLQARNRSLTDVLAIEGYSNTSPLSSALRSTWYYKRGLALSNNTVWPAVQDLVSLLEGDKENFLLAISKAHKIRPILPGGIATFLFYIFAEIDLSDAETFFSSLKSGLGFERGSAVKLLRDKLLSDLYSKRKLQRIERIGLCFVAWNALRSGKTVRSLRWTRHNGDEFPVAI